VYKLVVRLAFSKKVHLGSIPGTPSNINKMEENRKAIEEMLSLLSKAPDTQIDKVITSRLKGLIGKPIPEIKTGVMQSIDDCVYGSLSSGFGLQSLHILHEVYLDGKLEDFNETNCPWRFKER
jgi:hypothetical protein